LDAATREDRIDLPSEVIHQALDPFGGRALEVKPDKRLGAAGSDQQPVELIEVEFQAVRAIYVCNFVAANLVKGVSREAFHQSTLSSQIEVEIGAPIIERRTGLFKQLLPYLRKRFSLARHHLDY